mmetsp:Transcript_24562/g.57192  ORF Transcript_24562/g.57192 Transcript_24562/m.57192 type:complete len:382 (+) Transcript_24562:936-2081(+)
MGRRRLRRTRGASRQLEADGEVERRRAARPARRSPRPAAGESRRLVCPAPAKAEAEATQAQPQTGQQWRAAASGGGVRAVADRGGGACSGALERAARRDRVQQAGRRRGRAAAAWRQAQDVDQGAACRRGGKAARAPRPHGACRRRRRGRADRGVAARHPKGEWRQTKGRPEEAQEDAEAQGEAEGALQHRVEGAAEEAALQPGGRAREAASEPGVAHDKEQGQGAARQGGGGRRRRRRRRSVRRRGHLWRERRRRGRRVDDSDDGRHGGTLAAKGAETSAQLGGDSIEDGRGPVRVAECDVCLDEDGRFVNDGDSHGLLRHAQLRAHEAPVARGAELIERIARAHEAAHAQQRRAAVRGVGEAIDESGHPGHDVAERLAG